MSFIFACQISGEVEVRGAKESIFRSKLAVAFDEAEGEDPYAWLDQRMECPREAAGRWKEGMALTESFAAITMDSASKGELEGERRTRGSWTKGEQWR